MKSVVMKTPKGQILQFAAEKTVEGALVEIYSAMLVAEEVKQLAGL